MLIFRNTITFVKKGKAAAEEKEDVQKIVDNKMKDEIKAIHGSVFDLYLESLNITQFDM